MSVDSIMKKIKARQEDKEWEEGFKIEVVTFEQRI